MAACLINHSWLKSDLFLQSVHAPRYVLWTTWTSFTSCSPHVSFRLPRLYTNTYYNDWSLFRNVMSGDICLNKCLLFKVLSPWIFLLKRDFPNKFHGPKNVLLYFVFTCQKKELRTKKKKKSDILYSSRIFVIAPPTV